MKEKVCERCWKAILEYENFNYYKNIKGFLKDNKDIFCRCNGNYISTMDLEYLEIQYYMKHNKQR